MKSADGGERDMGEVGGTVMCHRSDPAGLVPVRKGVTERGGIKKFNRRVSEEGVPVRANEG